MTSPPDPLATALAAIRAEGYLDGPVPRLVAAVEAVQEMASEWERAGGSGAPVLLTHVERRACGSAILAAIERALTGEDGGDHE